MKETENQTKKRNKDRIIVGLSVATGILGLTTLGLGIGYGITQSMTNTYSTQLENVYQRNLYNLNEGVNNIETKLGKILATDNTDLQNKLLIEVTNNTDLAEQSISSLPISQSDFSDSVKFINQVGGYTNTLAKKVAKGNKLTTAEKTSLEEIKNAMSTMREEVGKFIVETRNNYSILQNSLNISENNLNNFTIRISKIKNDDVDYPTMIYDGPFSDSQTIVDIKGLTGEEISKEDAMNIVKNIFSEAKAFDYLDETEGKIATYNFKVETPLNNSLYAQISKIGGHLITLSGTSDSSYLERLDMLEGENIALSFATKNGIEDAVCVWKNSLNNNGYFNIAPKQNGIILYPDLVKVKIDLSSGEIIGYDSMTYFTNHVNRKLPKATLSESEAKKNLSDNYNFESGRLTLIPLEYSREVLCYEFVGQKNDETYYFYVNAQNGIQENILKVVNTSDESKLI